MTNETNENRSVVDSLVLELNNKIFADDDALKLNLAQQT